jgi:hypothetical protein
LIYNPIPLQGSTQVFGCLRVESDEWCWTRRNSTKRNSLLHVYIYIYIRWYLLKSSFPLFIFSISLIYHKYAQLWLLLQYVTIILSLSKFAAFWVLTGSRTMWLIEGVKPSPFHTINPYIFINNLHLASIILILYWTNTIWNSHIQNQQEPADYQLATTYLAHNFISDHQIIQSNKCINVRFKK